METPFGVLGRAPGVDIVLNDPALNRRHCYLQALGSKVLCIELRGGLAPSRARRRAPAGWIDARRGVRVGNTTLRLDDGTERAGGAGESVGIGFAAPDAPLILGPIPRINLEFRTNLVQTRWMMKRALVLVGSAPECGVRLNGHDVSRFHCALVRTTTGLWAVDLLGEIDDPDQGGIFVNGEPVRFAPVGPDDRLRIGRFEVTAHYPKPPRRGSTSLPAPAEREANYEGSSLYYFGSSDRNADPSDRPAPTGVEEVRAELEARFEQLATRQAGEIEALRREVEDLRELTEELRSRARPTRRVSHAGPPRDTPRNGNSSGHGKARARSSASRGTSVRVLGTAVRNADSHPIEPDIPSNHAAMAGAGFPVPDGFNGLDEAVGNPHERPNLTGAPPSAHSAVN
jgi:hypothetical protein